MPPTALYSPAPALHSAKRYCFYTLLVLGLILISECAFAVSDMPTILRNLRRIINPLTVLMLVVSFVCGVFFILKALIMFRKFGTTAQMGAQGGEVGGPILYLIVGAILLYLPTSTNILMNSLFGSTQSIFGGGGINYQQLGTGQTLLGYTGSSTLERQWADLANTLVLFIQLLGFLSFLRGWLIISKLGKPGGGGEQGGFAKGLTHLIGGIVAINFVGVMQIIKNTIFGS